MGSEASEQNPNTASEQRYFPRWNVRNRVLYRSESDPHPRYGHTKDLSCAGACVYLEEHLSPRQRVTLNIHLSPKTVVGLHGTVIWQDVSASPYLTGISFYGTSDDAQGVILEHAFDLDRKKILEHWYKGWDGVSTGPGFPKSRLTASPRPPTTVDSPDAHNPPGQDLPPLPSDRS